MTDDEPKILRVIRGGVEGGPTPGVETVREMRQRVDRLTEVNERLASVIAVIAPGDLGETETMLAKILKMDGEEFDDFMGRCWMERVQRNEGAE